jgi:hypothetical protein
MRSAHPIPRLARKHSPLDQRTARPPVSLGLTSDVGSVVGRQHRRPRPALDVLLVRHLIEMRRIHTTPIPTYVIDLEAFLDDSDEVTISDKMRGVVPALDVELAVAVSAD